MRHFKDSADRTWTIDINVVTRGHVLKATEGVVDVFGALDGSFQAAVAADPVLMLKVLYVLCADQVEKVSKDLGKDFDFDVFARNFDGDQISHAQDQLIEAITDFFPKSRRQALMAMTQKSRELEEETLLQLTKRVTQIDAKSEVQMLLKKASTSALASAGLVPEV